MADRPGAGPGLAAVTAAVGIVLAEPADVSDAGAYLARLVRLDAGALVRLQAHGDRVALFAQVPLGVLALRTVAARRSGENGDSHRDRDGDGEGATDRARPLDSTVSAAELLDALTAARGAGQMSVSLPIAQDRAWTRALPPRTGWLPVRDLPAAQLSAAVRSATAEFRRRAQALVLEPGVRRDRALESIGQAVWDQPLRGPSASPDAPSMDLPVRAVHAAHHLGFLHAESPARLRTTGSWLELAGAYGAVLLRRPGLPALDVRVLGVRRTAPTRD